MIVFKGLFWRLFIVLWLSNVVIIAVTVIIVSLDDDRTRLRNAAVQTAKTDAEKLISAYEMNGFRPIPGPRRPPRFSSEGQSAAPPLFIMFVKDLTTNRGIMGGPPPKIGPAQSDVIDFEMSLDGRRNYSVKLYGWRNSKDFMLKGLRKLLSLQFVIVFVVSAIAAWLISLMIVRPVNRLKTLVGAIRHGELATRPDEGLSQRNDEIGDLAREFHLMSEYLDQHITSQNSLMQDVSHELRAPLARLQAAAGLAQQKWGDDRLVVRIMTECERLAHLISELMSLSKLESAELVAVPFSAEEFVEQIVGDVQFSHPRRKINANIKPGLSKLKLNRGLLERAVMNAVVNACKYTEEELLIDISVEQQGNYIAFTVRDYGDGVSPSVLANLVKPFYRANPRGDGYGLGLCIAQRAMARLNGSMEMSNHSDHGLVVVFKVPMAIA